ncbi:MAG: cyclic nucleotide-binding domain-containing protein [Chloroflexi bacterium]|nr:cyclic nucleotide-binding domain-containing protein [Chloroflexota bacterium]
MSEDIIQQLKTVYLFRGLSDEALSPLAQKVGVLKLMRDDVLMRKGERGESLYMIHDGWMKVVTEDSRGGELIINKCGPGETIGEMALFDQAPRSASVIALEDVTVLELKQDDFQKILDERPGLSLVIIHGLSSRLRFSTTYIEKAIDWSQKIAEGDYSFIDYTPTLLRRAGSDEDKAGQLLSAFFKMVKRVKEREDGLKQQVEKLTFEIDQARRKREFDEITSTELYTRIKEQARKLREQRFERQDE